MPERLPVPGLAWNGHLAIYLHGYVSPYPERPPEIPADQYILSDGTSLPATINAMGYAFATTSFRTNGLAVKDGVADIMDLWGEFKAQHTLKRPSRVYLFGASEGGLIATEAIEKHPAQFDGGVAACGPIGDFRLQADHIGDMRVIFDSFFPGMLRRRQIEIPETLMANWPTIAPGIGYAVGTNPLATGQLLAVTQAAIDPANLATAVDTVLGVLWYNVFATNDARGAGWQSFRQHAPPVLRVPQRRTAQRHSVTLQGRSNALAAIEAQYQTTGRLRTPLVTLHNTLDPIVPYKHAALYQQKVASAGSSNLYQHIPAPRYGHCNFTTAEVLAALNWVVTMSGGGAFTDARDVMPSKEAYQRYLELTSSLQARP